MSDFDKEAERERLREKYERDQQKRESTERMSELLLKGATMTNAHCDQCGDPIFRYDGQEFCPTCQQPVESADGEDAPADESAADAPETEGGVAETESDGPAAADAPSAGGDAAVNDTGADAASSSDRVEIRRTRDAAPESAEPTETASASGTTAANGDAATRGQNAEPAGSPPSPPETEGVGTAPTGRSDRPSESSPTAASGGSLADAREAIVATLVTQSQRAAASDDPRRARDHLAAAREAAETLSALSSVR